MHTFGCRVLSCIYQVNYNRLRDIINVLYSIKDGFEQGIESVRTIFLNHFKISKSSILFQLGQQ